MTERWVIRRDVNGQIESEPLRCFMPHAIVAQPGVLTVEQCVASLVRDGEVCSGREAIRPIFLDNVLVGYIEVTRQVQPDRGQTTQPPAVSSSSGSPRF
jgi:hypothetical protein